MSICLFGSALTLGDILVIIAYTQRPHDNVDADISSGDRGLYHLHLYFTLNEPVPLHKLSRVASPSCLKMRYVPNAYVLATFNIKHAKVCASKISLRPIITLSVPPSVH